MPPKGKRLTQKSPKGQTPAKKARVPKKWNDAESILDNDKSPLYKDEALIKSIICHEDVKKVIGDYSLFGIKPDDLNNAIATFAENGKQGRHDTEWIRQACVASKQRASGDFDEYLKSKFDNDWADEGGEELSDDEDDVPKNTIEKNETQDSEMQDTDSTLSNGEIRGINLQKTEFRDREIEDGHQIHDIDHSTTETHVSQTQNRDMQKSDFQKTEGGQENGDQKNKLQVTITEDSEMKGSEDQMSESQTSEGQTSDAQNGEAQDSEMQEREIPESDAE